LIQCLIITPQKTELHNHRILLKWLFPKWQDCSLTCVCLKCSFGRIKFVGIITLKILALCNTNERQMLFYILVSCLIQKDITNIWGFTAVAPGNLLPGLAKVSVQINGLHSTFPWLFPLLQAFTVTMLSAF
jgi:hypothetical protein